MRKIFTLFILLFQLIAVDILAQDFSENDTIKIDKKIFNRIINNQFSFITTGQAKSTLSNFISYEAKESQISFNGVLPLCKDSSNIGTYLSINANGAISDGFFAIFNNSKLNSNTALELKLHFLGKKNRSISYSLKQEAEYANKIKNIESEYRIKKDSVSSIYQTSVEKFENLKNKIELLEKERDSISKKNEIKRKVMFLQDSIRNNLKAIQDILSWPEKKLRLSKEIENLSKLVNKTQEIKNELQDKKQELKDLIYAEKDTTILLAGFRGMIDNWCIKINTLKNNNRDCFIFTGISEKDDCSNIQIRISRSQHTIDSLLLKYSKEIQKYPTERNNLMNLLQQLNDLDKIKNVIKSNIVDNFKVRQVDVSWHSISFKITNNHFNLFNDSIAFDKQLIEKNFVKHEVAYEYNKYRLSNFNKTYYLNIRVGVFVTDNKDEDLVTKEIIENKLYPKDSTLNRTSTKKYNAYVGDYKQDILGMKLSLDYYNFIFKNNNGGIHLYPEVTFKNKYKPVYNLGIGMFLSFKNNTDIKSIVNAEFYFKFLDITSNNSVSSILKGNEAGIRMSFPIKFIFK